MQNVKFPSIQQFRNAVQQLRRLDNVEYVDYVGYTKLHGTNASIIVGEDFTLYPQSKLRILSVEEDNAGFAAFVLEREACFIELAKEILAENPEAKLPIEICGEFAGSNIQRNVALNGLDKFFAIFGYANVVDESLDWLTFCECIGTTFNDIGIYNIAQFGRFELRVTVDNPALVQNTLVELTEQVELECPAGKFFGVSGIGEGIVWRPLVTTFTKNKDLWFKVKGEKHSSSKVRTLASVDPEVAKSISEFVDYVLTESRLEQGIAEVGGADVTNTGAFLKWINQDILKEESDTLTASGLEFKDVAKGISRKAVTYFKNKI